MLLQTAISGDKLMSGIFVTLSQCRGKSQRQSPTPCKRSSHRRTKPEPAHLRQVDPEAYREYLRGRFFWEQRSEEALDRSISHFDRALQIDPNFALAYAAEAEAYIPLAVRGYRAPKEPFAKAKEMATKALALDDTLPGAHNALAAVRFNQYDWAGAEKEFKRAIELNPSYVPAHLWHGYFLEALGQQSANLAERKLAQELDPLNLTAGTGVGTAYFYLGQYDKAIEEQRKTLELDPGFSMALVTWERYTKPRRCMRTRSLHMARLEH